MKKQLLGISFDSTKSSCCDQEHQTSTGTLGRSFLFKVDFFFTDSKGPMGFMAIKLTNNFIRCFDDLLLCTLYHG